MGVPNYGYNNLQDFYGLLNSTVGYLEKANMSNLGDFSSQGKIVNAGYGNYTIYWDWFRQLGYGNLQGQPYCACYVSTMLTAAFGIDKAKSLLCGNLYTYCPTGYDQFKSKGRIYNTPKPFDIVFFWHNSVGRWGHTGIVVGVDSNGKGYTTIEANTSSGNNNVVRNGGATCRKHYNIGAARVAFGRPDYSGNGISTTKNNSVPSTPEHKEGDYSMNQVFDVGTGVGGLRVTAPNVNVRTLPGNGKVVCQVNSGEVVIPTKKTFVNGAPWFYLQNKGGWISAVYLTGWVLESTGKWWYMLPGYSWYSNKLATIDGNTYFFDADGNVFIGSLNITTDENGVIKSL